LTPADLRRAIATLAGMDDPGQLRVADGLALWIESGSIKLEECLGVAPTWRSSLRRQIRDEIYNKIALTRFPDLTGWPLARAITTAVSQYEAGAWRYDRKNGTRPSGINGLILDLLKLDERLLDTEALRKLVGKNRALEYPAAGILFIETEASRDEYGVQGE
jgi:hypothetical protein